MSRKTIPPIYLCVLAILAAQAVLRSSGEDLIWSESSSAVFYNIEYLRVLSAIANGSEAHVSGN